MSSILSLFGDNPINGIIVIGTIVVASLMAAVMHLSAHPATKNKIDDKAFENDVDDDGWAEDDEDNVGVDAGVGLPGAPAVAQPVAAVPATVAKSSTGGEDKSKPRQLPKRTQQQQQTHQPQPMPIPKARPRPKKVNDGPFSIGDRVILKNLVSATGKALNGRHGTIADLWDKKTERYPVDLDLFDPQAAKKAASAGANAGTPVAGVAVKPGNLNKEPAIPQSMVETRAPVEPGANGCLTETHGRAFSFIFSSMRQSVAASVHGSAASAADLDKMKDPQQILRIANFGWANWTLPNAPDGTKRGVYPSLAKYLTEGLPGQNDGEEIRKVEQQLNPSKPEGSYQLVKDAITDQRAVKGWNVRVAGEFYVVGMSPDDEGTFIVPASHPRMVYCVLGIKVPLGAQALGRFPRPPKFNLTLVPWFGRLVHDPFIATTTGTNQVEIADPKLTGELVEAVRLAQEEGRVVSRLAQLEVPGGSKLGLPFAMPVMTPPPPMNEAQKKQQAAMQQQAMQQNFAQQSPPNDLEKALVAKVSQLEPFPMPPSAAAMAGQPNQPKPNPLSAWNFIRKGETEEENPDHTGIIITAAGQQIAPFKCSQGIEPTPADILMGVVAVAQKVGKRPAIIGVDEPKCCARLQFLLREVGGTRVLGMNVTRKKKPASGATQPNAGAGAEEAGEKKEEEEVVVAD